MSSGPLSIRRCSLSRRLVLLGSHAAFVCSWARAGCPGPRPLEFLAASLIGSPVAVALHRRRSVIARVRPVEEKLSSVCVVNGHAGHRGGSGGGGARPPGGAPSRGGGTTP